MLSISRKLKDWLSVFFDPIINPFLKFSLSIMYRCATYDGEQFYYLPGASIFGCD